MKIIKTLFASGCLLILTASCAKKDNLIYHYNPETLTHKSTIKDITKGSSKIDVLWLIGGMTEQANNFQNGVQAFMSGFVQRPLSWRMAVVSSDSNQPPILGMPKIFDQTDPTPVATLVNGVMGSLNAYDGEQIFDPTVLALEANPTFLRPDAMLAIIMTNDASDRSRNVTQSAQMLNFLLSLKGSPNLLRVYGVFGATDLNCQLDQIDENWSFHGSEFEKLINATGGLGLSLCDATFGDSLSKIGDDIYNRLKRSYLYLKKRPYVPSLKVLYQGAELPPGPKNQGGYWHYNFKVNAVVFHDLDFSTHDTDEVTVTYQEYQGQ